MILTPTFVDGDMTQIARYTLKDGTEVQFEIETDPMWEQAGGPSEVIGKVKKAAQAAVGAAREVLELLEDAKPDEAEVTFSLKASGKTSWIVAKASTEGTMQVRLLWKAAPTASGA